MHANLLAQSDNVSGAELRAKGTIAVTIATIRVEELEHIDPNKKGKRPKGVIYFGETGAKPWVINKTNVEIFKSIFGGGRCGKTGSEKEHPDGKCVNTDHWIGHKIGLGATEQKVSGEKVDGIAVVACDAVNEPLDVVVKLRSKAARTYTVKPFVAKPPAAVTP